MNKQTILDFFFFSVKEGYHLKREGGGAKQIPETVQHFTKMTLTRTVVVNEQEQRGSIWLLTSFP